MSGILGIWNLDGAPVSQSLLLRMNEALRHRGPDGTSHVIHGNVAFAHQRMNVTPESLHETQPLCSQGVIAVMDGRLDNRESLIARSKESPPDSDRPDIELVLRTYLDWGEQFAAHIEGDFAVAILDQSRRRLLLVRDSMGARNLYFCRVGQHFLFASEVKALLRHPGVETRLDESSLAEFLFSYWDHRDETNTFFADIKRVPVAHTVLVTGSGDVAARRHFDFDTTTVLRLRDQREYTEAYREAFSTAVRRRLRSAHPTAITVSGGLDSSSIYCMAHVLQRDEPQSVSPLIPVGLVVADRPSAAVTAAEWQFQKVVQDHCAAEIVRIPTTSFSFAQDSTLKAWHSEGPWVMQDVYGDLYQAVRQRGARVLLGGDFGDNLLMNTHFLLDLVLGASWLKGWRCYRGIMTKPWFLFEEGGPDREMLHGLLLRELRSFLLPEILRSFYRTVRYRWFHREARPPYFSERFLRIANDVYRSSSVVKCRPGRAHVKALYLAARSKCLNWRIEMEANGAAMYSMEPAYPYRDKDLVQLVMSMPGDVVYPGGDSRGIHREAMNGILPDLVRLRRTKGDFTRLGRRATVEEPGRLRALMRGHVMRMGILKPEAELGPEVDRMLQMLSECEDKSKDSHVMAWNLLALEALLESFFAQDTLGHGKIQGNLI